MTDKDKAKVQKKLAKTEAKAAKKSPGESEHHATPGNSSSPAERSATAAEKQLALHRWKVIFAGVSALIALVTLVVLLFR